MQRMDNAAGLDIVEINSRVQQERFYKCEEHFLLEKQALKVKLCLPMRYRVQKVIGMGTYGIVVLATDTQTNERVAIKKLTRPFTTEIEARRTFREIHLLRHARHPNIVSLVDIFTPHMTWTSFSTSRDREEVYIVTRYAGPTLAEIIENKSIAWSALDKKLMLYNILRGLQFLHSVGLIHRDLKPANIAVGGRNMASILDFGLARAVPDDSALTGYVVTKGYRAPELIYNLSISENGLSHYTSKVDVFSAGVIMAEMELRKPLFDIVDNQRGFIHLAAFLNLMGRPSDEWLGTIADMPTRTAIAKWSDRVKSPEELRAQFEQQFMNLSDEGIDLLIRMLDVDPRRRISTAEALMHPYFEGLHNQDNANLAHNNPIVIPHEDILRTAEQWKRAVWTEMQNSATQGNGGAV
ncbi:mitogen-activated protein kinase 14-like [Paramacrobiotus metropolitanus]|uniref:mitogen-activated protein kinase 14-like n=1 Tax=Paramacrobiotus metropolitanus TaxID=2943436 RepID=UPI0024459F94|nr:mitogen-activated protein kinase 14-like [Paramacrobiotus metropolitanus]